MCRCVHMLCKRSLRLAERQHERAGRCKFKFHVLLCYDLSLSGAVLVQGRFLMARFVAHICEGRAGHGYAFVAISPTLWLV